MDKNFGLYIHVPFCRNKCPYCDFYSIKFEETCAADYVEKLIHSMKEYEGLSFDTIYLGGGTPSILPSNLIKEILDAAKEKFHISSDAEITIECNPSKDLEEDFKVYSSCGINRVSIGMQSAKKEERLALGRIADKNQVEKCINDARNAGINNISLDIMLGTPKQTLESLDETFNFIEKMNVQHISAYMLQIEQDTKFYELQDKLDLPREEAVSKMYLKTIECLENIGFKQYEISNFAKEGFESRHNNKYWNLTPYLGLGPSAHSFLNGKRFYYDIDMNCVYDGEGGNAEEEIMLGLRLTKGIKKDLITKDIDSFVKEGLLKINDDTIALTSKGMLISNYVISQLI